MSSAAAHKPTDEEQKQIDADAAFARSLMEQEGQTDGAATASAAPVPPAGNESAAAAGAVAPSQPQSSASCSHEFLSMPPPFNYTQASFVVAGGGDDEWEESYSSDDGGGDGDVLGDYDYYGGCVRRAFALCLWLPLMHCLHDLYSHSSPSCSYI